MADATQDATAGNQSSTQTGLLINPALRKKHPELIGLIERSESMNDGERQYWIDILPVMTPEQIGQLKEILTNERNQLAAIDAKYAKEIGDLGVKRSVEEMGKERKDKIEERRSQEEATRPEEEEKAQKLLDQIDE